MSFWLPEEDDDDEIYNEAQMPLHEKIIITSYAAAVVIASILAAIYLR